MTEADDNAEQLQRALAAERRRLRELGKEPDIVDRDINPPRLPIDHAADGGVI